MGEDRVDDVGLGRLDNPNCVPGSLSIVFAALNDDDKPGFATAPHVYVCQEVGTEDSTALLDLLNAAAPSGVSYALGTYTNFAKTTGAQALYYRQDTLLEIANEHVDILTGAGRYADRWKLELVGKPDVVFYIYSVHLPASEGGANELLRLAGVEAIRDDADLLPDDTHVIYAGDMNFYDSGEPGYLEFLSAGPGQAVDPGAWTDALLSQSPRCTQRCGLIGGCLDDRFDHQLVTDEWLDGDGLDLVPDTLPGARQRRAALRSRHQRR